MKKLNFAGAFRPVAAFGCACALAASLGLPQAAFANPTIESKQAEAQAAYASLNAMQQQLAEAENNHFAAEQERQQAEDKMNDAQHQIDEASGKIGKLQSKLGTRARSMYRTGTTSMLELLLGSTSFEEFATNWDLLNSMNQKDADLVSETKKLRETISASKIEYARQAKVAADKAAEAKKIEEQAQATVSTMQQTYDNLNAEVKALVDQERRAKEAAEAARAQQTIQAAIQSASNPSSSSGGGSNSGGGGGSVSAAPAPSYSPQTGNAIVDRAYAMMGKPYVWGAVGPSGFDCSGLVSYAITGSFSRLGTTYTYMGYPRVSDPQPGDICTNWDHCGIYIGNGQMIHAPTTGDVVKVGPIQSGMIFVRP